MEGLPGIGKILIIIGTTILIVGIIILFAGKIPFIGKLPGDITIRRENFTFYFPIATCIIISVILTLIIYALKK